MQRVSLDPLLPELTRFGCPIQLVEVCVADGDAPPERFDHSGTLIREEVHPYTKPNFLTMNGFDPCRNRGQITVHVGHRSDRLSGPISNPTKT